MKIRTIKVNNFRLLKAFKIDLEKEISLIIGKNNTAKTSLLSVIEKFLTDKSDFSINDFNLDTQKKLGKLENEKSIDIPESFEFKIDLYFHIEYNNSDNLKNISNLILNLEGENIVVLGFEHFLNQELYEIISEEFKKYKTENPKKRIIDFLKLNTSKRFFKTQIKAIEYKSNGEYGVFEIIKEKKLIEKVITFQNIKAKREVNNSDTNRSDQTLSKLSSDYYESLENTPKEEETITKLKKELEITDEKLNVIYPEVFKEVLKKIELFGGKIKGESIINIISSLQSKNILKENTSVVYSHLAHQLPEDYHGLGYMNLFAMIFDLELKCREFRKEKEIIENQIPSDINLLFIEEPEAHTHPQMQNIFIKNIETILHNEKNGLDASGKKDSNKKSFNLQTIITTHSSNITAESNFDDIKYFYKDKKLNQVESKNLKELIDSYEKDSNQYKFLKQYLTLNRAELFFADKAVLIEGDTERILLPVMMNKLDIENSYELPLLSQNISIIEVGAYAHVFEKFIDFIGIKYFLITDIDSFKKVDSGKKNKDDEIIYKEEPCRVEDTNAKGTSNSSLNYFLTGKSFIDLKESSTNYYIKENNLSIGFQHKQNNYHARSFEDAFIHINREFIKKHKDSFKGIKNKSDFDLSDKDKDAYDLAEDCIKKKTHFALDIVYHSDINFSNWDIPQYIKEGLLWLQK